MCDHHLLVTDLAAQAKLEKPPQIDVVGPVMRRVRDERESALTDRFWTYFAVGSFATAVVVFLLCLPILRSVTDPFYELFQASMIISQ